MARLWKRSALVVLFASVAVHAQSLEDLKAQAFTAPDMQGLRAGFTALEEQKEGPEDTHALHETNPPAHQWIVREAAKLVSDPELWDGMPDAWSDSPKDLDKAPITYGSRYEDAEYDKADLLCIGHPYCQHFWDPYKGDNAGLHFIKQWDSAYTRARMLWDTKALPAYRAGKKKEALYWLGRVAHLLSDLGAPAHTHLDAHALGDSFEIWCSRHFHDFPASGEPVRADDLHTLFYSMATLSAGFDSEHVAGHGGGHPLGHAGAWECHRGLCKHWNVSYAEAGRQAQVLMPAVIRHVAGLYVLFLREARRQSPAVSRAPTDAPNPSAAPGGVTDLSLRPDRRLKSGTPPSGSAAP